ncbi:biotin carboxylase [Asanoa ferruginea]|uniref:Biotin carboxylase n=1 Tax=Asanoa ferruginea TaxID=53367 RepID=A0A3D9ZPS8_9ACTN|nr:hypothetical protein [Asanoa ferruginea]REF99376.1 biotin carboxylase [Asanoa ferruginea]GIF45980.1 hypothetical protein Afe04nite_05190 [Asanoa ferruginea]
MTRLVVVYDKGAATPVEVGAGLGDLGEVVFALPPSPFNDRLLPLVRELGEVLPLPPERAGAQGSVEAVRRLRPTAVLTFSESRLRLTATLTEALGLPGHSVDTANALTDKRLQRARLREAGLTVRSSPISGAATGPGSWADALAEVGLPAVLKPARGEGSRTTHLVTSAAPHPDAGPGMVLEEYLPGREMAGHGDYVSVESVVARGEITHVAITGKHALLPPFREQGDFWPALLEPGEEQLIQRMAARALRALGVDTGVTHIEIKLTPAGPRIIEVNGRQAGYLNGFAKQVSNVDVVRLAGLVSLGERPDVAPVSVASGVVFQFFNPAPTFACRMLSVTGTRDLRALPGVTGYRRLIHPGTEIAGGVMTNPLDVLYGSAPDHLAMLHLIERAGKLLAFTFGLPSGERIEVSPGEIDERTGH